MAVILEAHIGKIEAVGVGIMVIQWFDAGLNCRFIKDFSTVQA